MIVDAVGRFRARDSRCTTRGSKLEMGWAGSSFLKEGRGGRERIESFVAKIRNAVDLIVTETLRFLLFQKQRIAWCVMDPCVPLLLLLPLLPVVIAEAGPRETSRNR